MRLLAVAMIVAASVGGCAPSAVDIRDRAISEFQVGRIDRAEEMLRVVLDRRPFDPEALYFMGRVQHLQKNYVQADYYYRCTLDAAPGHSEARMFLRKVRQDMGMEAPAQPTWQP